MADNKSGSTPCTPGSVLADYIRRGIIENGELGGMIR